MEIDVQIIKNSQDIAVINEWRKEVASKITNIELSISSLNEFYHRIYEDLKINNLNVNNKLDSLIKSQIKSEDGNKFKKNILEKIIVVVAGGSSLTVFYEIVKWIGAKIIN